MRRKIGVNYMKKLFIALIIIGSLFTSCTKCTVTRESYSVNDFCNLDILTETITKTIFVDKNTDVLYLYCGGAMSPIMKSDGTCLTLTEWKENHNIKD